MLDVALIHPPRTTTFDPSGNQFPIMPVGLFSIGAELRRAGYSVRIYDLALEAMRDVNFDLKDRLKKLHARYYGIDFQWFVHAHGALEAARLAKESHPSSGIFLGGMSASWFAEQLALRRGVDAVVVGEAEETTVELVSAMESGRELSRIRGLVINRGGSFQRTEPREPVSAERFDQYDFTQLDLLEDADSYLTMGNKPKNMWLPTARACPFNCAYCGGSREGYAAAMLRKAVAFRKAESVARDVEVLASKGVKVVSLTHDPEIAGERYWRPLFQQLREAGSGEVGLYVESFRAPSRTYLEEMRDVGGATVAVSPESASESVRKFVGRELSDDKIFSSLEAARDLGIPALVYFLVGLPSETWDSFSLFEPMVTKIVQQKLGFVFPPIPYTVDPNSPMAIRPEDYGVRILARDLDDYDKMSVSNRDEDWIAHETKWLSRADIASMLRKSQEIVFKLYGNPRLLTFQRAPRRLGKARATVCDCLLDLSGHVFSLR